MGTSLTNQEGESRTYRVQGRARDAKGLPASQIKVAVFDTDLRSEQLLGEAVTDEGGNYRLEYSTSTPGRERRPRIDLRVRAYDADNSIIAESPVRFAARHDETIDLTLVPNQTRLRSMFLWLIERLRGL